MYSYISPDQLAKGLKLGELIYQKLDKKMLSNPVFVDAALKHSSGNISFVPLQYFEVASKEGNFSLKKFIETYKLDNFISLFILSLFNAVEMDEISLPEKNKQEIVKLMQNKAVFKKIISGLPSNSKSSLCYDDVFDFFSDLSANHPVFNDLNYAKEILKFLDANSTESLSAIAQVISEKSEESEEFKNDSFVQAFLFFDTETSTIKIPETIKKNPKKVKEILSFAFKRDNFMNNWSNVLHDYNWGPVLKNDKDFVKFFIEALFSKEDEICVDYLLDFFGKDLKQDYAFIFEVLKGFDKPKNILFIEEPDVLYDLEDAVKTNPEFISFLINRVVGFLFYEVDEEMFTPKRIKKDSSAKKLFPLVDVEKAHKYVLNDWYTSIYHWNMELIFDSNFSGNMKKNQIKEYMEKLKQLLV